MAGTVTYSAGVFSIYDGEVSIAEMETAKGSSLALTDTTYVYTNTSMGILGILDTEQFLGSLYVGQNSSAVVTPGQLKIYGGGDLQLSSTGNFEIVRDYGSITTYDTTSSSKAGFDANQCSNDLKFNGSFDCKYLEVTNIKVGGYVDLQYADGKGEYMDWSAYGDGVYYFKGVPEDDFHFISCDLGKASPGIFTDAGYPDIDLLSDAYIREAFPKRPNQFGYAGVDGRKSAMLLKGNIFAGVCRILIEPSSSTNSTVKKDIEFIHSNQLPFLFVLTSHGDVSLPNDIIWRGRLTEGLHGYNTWDMRTMELQIAEDT